MIKKNIEIYKNKHEKDKNKNSYQYNIFIDNIRNAVKSKYSEMFDLDKIILNINNNNKSFNNNNNENSVKYKKIIYGDLMSSRSFFEMPIKLNKKKISNENSIISHEEKNELDYTSFSFNNDDNNNSNYTNISLVNNNITKNNNYSDIKLLKNNISNLSSIKINNNETNNVKLSSSKIPYPLSRKVDSSFLDKIKIKIYDKNNIYNNRNNKKNIFINNSSIENLKQTKASNKSLNNSNISENPINNNTNYIFNFKNKKEIYRNDNNKFHKSKSCVSLQNNFSLNNIKIFKKSNGNSKDKSDDNNNDKQKYFSNKNYHNTINNIYIVNNIFFNKLNPLLQKTFCYYRMFSPYHKQFNPIKDISLLLCKPPYNYIKSTIFIGSNYDCIKIIPSSSLENIIYPIYLISNSAINSIMKIIIEINRNYKKYKSLNKNWNKREFILSQKNKYLVFEDDEIEKCCYNKYYNFFVILTDERKLEFLFSSYEEFKIWINGISFIIKNKKAIIQLVDNRNKINN